MSGICDFTAGSDDLEAYLGAGIRGAQSTPVVSRSGALLGMVSTSWREPHELSASELRALDVMALLAADLIEHSRAGESIWEVDVDVLYLDASRAVEQILGYKPEEIVGRMHFFDLFDPETREETKTAAFEVFDRQ